MFLCLCVCARMCVYMCVCVCVCVCVGWKSRDSVPKLVEQYLGGNLKIDEFVSHTMSLADINNAFELMHLGKRCVVIIVCSI